MNFLNRVLFFTVHCMYFSSLVASLHDGIFFIPAGISGAAILYMRCKITDRQFLQMFGCDDPPAYMSVPQAPIEIEMREIRVHNFHNEKENNHVLEEPSARPLIFSKIHDRRESVVETHNSVKIISRAA